MKISLTRNILALTLLVVSGSVTSADVKKEKNIEFRLAYKPTDIFKPGIKTVPILLDGQQYLVAQTAAFTGYDISSAIQGETLRYKIESDGSTVPVHGQNVTITMSESGAKKLKIITKNNIRRYLILFVNSKPIISPQILAEIKDGVLVLSGLSKTQAQEVAGYFCKIETNK